MGTRGNTLVIETGGGKDQIFANIYRQFDSYPAGHGKDLLQVLSKVRMVNGIGLDDVDVANGVGCLAAQLIKHLKDGPGGIYMEAPTKSACVHDFTYVIRANTYEPGPVNVEVQHYGRQVFKGGVEEFAELCDSFEY